MINAETAEQCLSTVSVTVTGRFFVLSFNILRQIKICYMVLLFFVRD